MAIPAQKLSRTLNEFVLNWMCWYAGELCNITRSRFRNDVFTLTDPARKSKKYFLMTGDQYFYCTAGFPDRRLAGHSNTTEVCCITAECFDFRNDDDEAALRRPRSRLTDEGYLLSVATFINGGVVMTHRRAGGITTATRWMTS